MAKRVFVGAASKELHDQWMGEVRRTLEKKDKRLVYLLPTGTLIKRFRMELTDESGKGFIGHVEGTFDDLISSILNGESFYHLKDFEQEWLLKQVLDDLPYGHPFGGKNKDIVLSSVLQAIQELKQSGIAPDKVKENIINHHAHLDSLIEVYAKYQSLLDSLPVQPVDEADLYQKAITKVRNGEADIGKKVNHLYLENFVDLSPLQAELLLSIIPHIDDVSLHFLWDGTIEEEVPVAYENHQSLLRQLADLGVEIVRVHAESDLELPVKIELIPSINKQKEVRDIFWDMTRLHNEGIAFADMAVSVQDEEYRRLIIEMAEECAIPIAEPHKKRLNDHSLLRDWHLLLSLKNDESKSEDVKAVLWSPYLYGDLQHEADIKRLLEEIPEQGTIVELCESLLFLFNRQSLQKRIVELLRKGKLTLQQYKRDAVIIKRYIAIINRMKASGDILGIDRLIAFTDMLHAIEQLCRDEHLFLEEGDHEGVRVIHPSALIADHVQVLFSPGMNEKSPSTSNWLVKGVRAAKLPPREWERMLFQFETKAAQRIHVFSYVCPSLNETMLLSSNMEDYLRSHGIDWKSPRYYNKDATHTLPYPKHSTAVSLVEKRNVTAWQLRNRNANVTSIDQGWEFVISASEIERNRQANMFNEWSGRLTSPTLLKRMNTFYSETKVFSASELDVLAACSYRFMLQRVMKLNEEDQQFETLSPVDRGSFIHEVLQELYSKAKEEGFLNQIDQLHDELLHIFHGVTGELEKNQDLGSTPYWNVEKQSILLQLQRFVSWDYAEWRSKVGMSPAFFELSFGMEDEPTPTEPITISLGEGQLLKLRGRIDRVDVKDGSFVIVDYKGSLGNIPSADHIMKGAALQLPLYMLVLSEWFKQNNSDRIPVGGYYFSYSKASRKGLGDKSLSSRNPIESMVDALEEVKSHMREQLAQLRNANFSLKPRYCSPYCPYSEICRFDRKQPVREEMRG